MLVPFLIGLALGAAWALGAVFSICVVRTKESWKEYEASMDTMRSFIDMLRAENGKLRISLATGSKTEEGKKIAAITMAALSKVIRATSRAVLGEDHPAFQKEPEKQGEAEAEAPPSPVQ